MSSAIKLDDQVTFVTDPVSPCSGTDFTVSWQEKNAGDEASDDYQDIFDMDDQGTGDSQQLSCGGLAPGATALRTLTFNLPAGDYQMSLVINGVGPVVLGNVIIDDCPPDSTDDGSGNE
jgi:hypothetical protein